jgi:hypothetical protein
MRKFHKFSKADHLARKGVGVKTTTTEKHVGRNVVHKLFAVCGDNASPNDTFYDHLLQRLHDNGFDDDPSCSKGLDRCRFRGRASRVRCIAHIIALVVGAILAYTDGLGAVHSQRTTQRRCDTYLPISLY